jgi:glycosyltransferase involved in cell wall biosynthesis
MRTILPDSLYTAFSDLYMFIKNNFPSRHEKNLQQDKRFTVYDANQYLRRREFFMERLNSLDIVHFSSRRFAEIFIRYGLLKDKVKVIPHSTKNIEAITPKPLRGAQYPVVFGFLGGTWTHKGYQVLIKAFSCLDQNKAKLIVSGIKEMPSLNQNLNVEFREPFRQKELNNLLQQIDVGIVPSVWEEAFGVVGLEFLTAKIPVIASNIGGITEWLKDQENGFLVTPNNIEELTSKMRLFVDNPGLISEIQKKIKPCKTFAQHSLEIISLYEEVILQKKKGTLS